MAQKEKILNAIRNKAKEILPEGYRLRLFGSRARGDFREDSDWDIHILIPGEEKLSESRRSDLSYPFEAMGWDYGEFISVWMYTKKDWERRHFLPFYKNVEEEGIDI